MYCPNCKAEYRAGLIDCSDCHVPLLEARPEQNSPAAYVTLWRGEDPIFHDLLIDELETAGIRYADIPIDVYLRNSENIYHVPLGPQFGFVLSVRNSDLPPAQSILENLLNREPDDVSFAEDGREVYEEATAGVPDLPLRWDRELATLEIWTGDDSGRARFLEASLRENGIPARILEGNGGQLRVLIHPEAASRAGELARQIAEGSVPESQPADASVAAWRDEPVRSYLFAWLPGSLYFGIVLLVAFLQDQPGNASHLTKFTELLFAVGSFVSNAGAVWMIYQAIRYEVRPWRFILLACVPLSFGWYYYERYSRRCGSRRVPIAVRMRMSPPTA